MLQKIALRLAGPAGALIRGSRLGRAATGFGAGTVLSLVTLQWLISQGTGPVAMLAMGLAVVTGIGAGLFVPIPARFPSRLWSRLAGLVTLLAIAASSPLFLSVVIDGLWSSGRLAAGSSVSQVAWLWCAALMLVGLPAALSVWLVRCAGMIDSVRVDALALSGVALGVLFQGAILAPALGLTTAALWSCAVALLVVAADCWNHRRIAPVETAALVAESASTPGEPVFASLGCLGAGVALIAQWELWAHLGPITINTVVGMVAGGIAGGAMGLALGRWMRSNGTSLLLAAGWLALGSLGLYLVFPAALRLQLALNASGLAMTSQVAFRLLGPALCSFGIVGAATLWLTAACAPNRGERIWQLAAVLAGLAGCLLGTIALPMAGGPQWLLTGVVGAILVCSLPTAWRLRDALKTSPVRWVGGVVMGLLVLACLVPHRYDPARAARIAFSSQALSAYAAGVELPQLPWLDEARLMAQTRGRGGVYTAWKYAGHQVQIRQNGIPKGVLSTRPDLFPRHPSDTLAAVLPLVMHERPRRLVLLGLSSGETLSVALQHPLERVVCLEADQALVDLVAEVHVAGAMDEGESADLAAGKLTRQTCDPVAGLAAETEPADVIVSLPDSLSQLQSQAYYTREFYTLAARRLEAGGIFCQRVQMFDYGPSGLRTVLQTMQQAFPQVMLLEGAPGEFLCLGTSSEDGFVRGRLVARCETTHVRNLLGQSGFDWSTLFQLPSLDPEAVRTFCESSTIPTNSAGQGWLALGMPRELIRWGNKVVETQAALSPLASQVQSWLPGGSGLATLERRVGEVQSQQDLMARFTNQYWAYRATLRDQVSKKSRSQLQPVTLEEQRRMHPEDRRRLAYFEVLGRAVKTHTVEDIERLSLFESPYDPLVSYFLHQEAAELLRSSAERDVVRELEHRLHSTWFSSPRDASSRNVMAALELLRDHPECTTDAMQRWDEMNGLLQALQRRWSVRAQLRPSTARSLVADADQTLLAVQKTFDTMDRLAPEAGIAAEDWAARREVLDQTLVRLVQSQKNQWLPQALRRRQFGVDEPESPETGESSAPAPQPMAEPQDNTSDSIPPDVASRDDDE